MWDWALPVGYAVFLWWFGTVVVLYLNGLSRKAARRGFWVGTILAGGALATVIGTRESTGALDPYLAFSAGVIIWGWHELSYYAGMVTGPNEAPCPSGASAWRRFHEGVRTCLHHELAVIATAIVLAVLTWGATNPVALWTFAILWLMRWSAKLNIFLGVRNLHEEFWPRHLAYLSTYTRQRPMNALFPISVIGAGTVLGGMLAAAFSLEGSDPLRTGLLLTTTLLGLAILEHCLLMLPISDELLWRWGLRSHELDPTAPGAARQAP